MLSYCEDVDVNYVCDVCSSSLPYISIIMSEGCLVNGKPRDDQYYIGSISFPLVFTCEENASGVKEWIIYDSQHKEVSRVSNGSVFIINDPGIYYVEPIFK